MVMPGSFYVRALFPSVQHPFAIHEIDDLLVERIERAEGQIKREVVRLREIIMPLLVFVLEHQFVYVLSEPSLDRESKIFYWQIKGIGIESVCSCEIADLTMLRGERLMLKALTAEGFQIPIYTRYVDDIYFIIWGSGARVQQGYESIEKGLNSVDERGGSVEVEEEGVVVKEGEEKTLSLLDVEVALKFVTGGRVLFETGVYRKPSAGNTYTHWKSAQDEKVKTGLVRSELVRYVRLCSTECTFEKAWQRFRGI